MINIFMHLALMLIGILMLMVGMLVLRVKRRLRYQPVEPTYGPGVDKHLLRSGPYIEHGMVLDKDNNLRATSKILSGYIESLLSK